MPDNRLAGLAQTVLGPVPPDSLGPTLSHEHLLIDFTCMFNPPDEASGQFRAQEPVGLENLGWVRYNYFSNRDNLLLTDEQTAIAEAALYRRVGGATIVDATTIGIGRDPLADHAMGREDQHDPRTDHHVAPAPPQRYGNGAVGEKQQQVEKLKGKDLAVDAQGDVKRHMQQEKRQGKSGRDLSAAGCRHQNSPA